MTQQPDHQQNPSSGSSAAPAEGTAEGFENAAALGSPDVQGIPAAQGVSAQNPYGSESLTAEGGSGQGGYEQSGYASGYGQQQNQYSQGQYGYQQSQYAQGSQYAQSQTAQPGSQYAQNPYGQGEYAQGQYGQSGYQQGGYYTGQQTAPAEKKPNFFGYIADAKFAQPFTRATASLLYIVILAFAVLAWIGLTVQGFQYASVYGGAGGVFNLIAGAVAVLAAAGLAKMVLEFFLNSAEKHSAEAVKEK